jgi:hypothetical protein
MAGTTTLTADADPRGSGGDGAREAMDSADRNTMAATGVGGSSWYRWGTGGAVASHNERACETNSGEERKTGIHVELRTCIGCSAHKYNQPGRRFLQKCMVQVWDLSIAHVPDPTVHLWVFMFSLKHDLHWILSCSFADSFDGTSTTMSIQMTYPRSFSND